MKILLVRAKPHKETIGLQSVMICEPLELMTLKSVLTANNHDVTVIDMILEKKSLLHFLKYYNPDVVGFTGYISHINIIKKYAQITKNFNANIKTLIGGVHAEVYPSDFGDTNIDKICSCAEDFYKFLNCSDTSFKLPDRNLPPKYRKHYYYLFHKNCALIKTSFGCPYNCKFCFCKEVSKYSARDIDDVIEELQTIKQEEVYIMLYKCIYSKSMYLYDASCTGLVYERAFYIGAI